MTKGLDCNIWDSWSTQLAQLNSEGPKLYNYDIEGPKVQLDLTLNGVSKPA